MASPLIFIILSEGRKTRPSETQETEATAQSEQAADGDFPGGSFQ